MPKIAIVTDTDSSLPVELASRYNIRQVPIIVQFGEETYTTGVDIDDRLVFEKIDRLNKLPTTSAPSPGAFAAAFEQAFQDGAEAVVCVCVSSKVSATYGSAVAACDQFPGKVIRVVDSLNLAMGQGFMVLAAAEAARGGASVDQVVEAALNTGKHVHVYAVLPTLKYLALSGRVGKLVAGLAGTFNIMPVLSVKEGKLDLLERIRTRKKAIERMLELTRQSIGSRPVVKAAVIHVNNPVGARELQVLLCETVPCPEQIITAQFTPGLSIHAGTGVVGVVLLTAE